MPYKIQPVVPMWVPEEYAVAAIPTSFRSSKALAVKEAKAMADKYGVQYTVITPGGRYVQRVSPDAWILMPGMFAADPDRIYALLAQGLTPAQALEIAEREHAPLIEEHGTERAKAALKARQAVTV
jgi:nucleoside-diphosphate-sugar epimerase